MSMKRPVVVGVDGSPSSVVAAEQAAEAAVARSCPLHLVHGYLHPFGYGVPLNPYEMEVPPPNDDAQKMLDQAAAELRDRWPGLEVEVRQVAGGPGATLVEESRHADLVVVGSRGRGGFTGLLLGSVSTQVATHAHCPVLVVRPIDEPLPVTGPVVVGVDGSDSGRAAVDYAADEAVRRSTGLVLLHAWSTQWAAPVATGAAPGMGWPPERFDDFEQAYQEAATQLLDEAVGAVRARHPDLAVERRPTRAISVEQALIEASGQASLLVVGSRGLGGFTGLLLGSVSRTAVHHAHCPVLVVRGQEDPAGD
ncbi:universal stress protein [Plantactinospora sp. GCM10030261]|uniref:universal stress protein n=1 Tax=Plantactinospora sp. GCM10030261 TaxID=3273420 RepID=UPI00360F7480